MTQFCAGAVTSQQVGLKISPTRGTVGRKCYENWIRGEFAAWLRLNEAVTTVVPELLDPSPPPPLLNEAGPGDDCESCSDASKLALRLQNQSQQKQSTHDFTQSKWQMFAVYSIIHVTLLRIKHNNI